MKNKLGITKGEIKYVKSLGIQWFDLLSKQGDNLLRSDCLTESEIENNCILYVNAHNTANKCGKLPSQLLQENEEMKAICNYLFEKVNKPVARHKINAEFYDRYHEIQLLLTKINQQ